MNRALFTGDDSPGNSRAEALAMVGLLLISAQLGRGEITGPYAPDEQTLHLWHMNVATPPVPDRRSNGVNLGKLENGATLGNESYVGAKHFGTALGTYVGNPAVPPGCAGQSAGISSLGFENGRGDNTPVRYAGPDDAFTYEALVRVDFEPAANYGPTGLGRGKTPSMQIISGDADENSDRVFQFRLAPLGTLNGNEQPLLEFINLNQGNSVQSLTAEIPTAGAEAIAAGTWYHLAVTYDGHAGQADNLRFYWTRVRSEAVVAHQIGSGEMTHPLPKGCNPDFAIGQTGRQSPVTPTPNNNFVGLIDEVRISGVARLPGEMLFRGAIATVAPTTDPAAADAPPTKPEVIALEATVAVKPEPIPPATLMSGAVARGTTNKPRLALLFSCRESDGAAIATVEMLKTHQTTASFFVTRNFLEPADNRLLVQSMLVQSHYVGLQGDLWGKLTSIADSAQPGESALPPEIDADLEQLAAFGIAAENVRYFLPTAEQLNPGTAGRARQWGLIMVAGTPGTLSFATTTPDGTPEFVSSQAILDSILEAERQPGGLNGYLLLFHLSSGDRQNDKFYNRFGELIATLRARGYDFVRVDQLLDESFPRKTRPSLAELDRP